MRKDFDAVLAAGGKTNAREFIYYQKLITPDIHLLTPGEKKHHHKPAVVTKDWDGAIRQHVKAGGNLGFNPASAGLLVIDIDVKRIDGRQNLGALLDKHGIELPKTAMVSTPSSGTHIYLGRNHYPGRLWSSLRDCPGVDFLSSNCNVVCAGSVLENGEYKMLHSCPPAQAPDALLDLLRMGQSSTTTASSAEPTISEIDLEEALERLPNPDLGYEEYLRIGMAIHFETGGSDRGFELWTQWASKSDKFIESDCAKRWASFSTSGSGGSVCTFGTIDRIGRELNTTVFNSVGEAAQWLAEEKAQEAGPSDDSDADDSGIEMPPGTMGELANFILSYAASPLPEAALMGAINVVGTLTGNRFTVANRVRLNLYQMLVARTASGKDSAFGQSYQIMSNLGCLDLVASGATSGPSLRKNIQKSRGQTLSLHIDEASRWISSGKNPQSHDNTTRFELMELFARAGTVMPGRAALNTRGEADEKAREPLKYPFLSLMCATTPDRFLRSLESIDFADGFLNRMLVFFTEQVPDINKDANPGQPLPSDLEARLKAIARPFIDLDPADPEGPADVGTPDAPKNLKLSPWADQQHDEFTRQVRRGEAEGIINFDLWQRAPEILLKLSGLVAAADGANEVSDEAYSWAARTVKRSFGLLDLQILENHASSESEDLLKKILKFIRDKKAGVDSKRWGELIEATGGKPLGLITSSFHRYERRKREAALEDLVEGGSVRVIEIRLQGKKPTKVYCPVD